jgi:hypothetical protein
MKVKLDEERDYRLALDISTRQSKLIDEAVAQVRAKGGRMTRADMVRQLIESLRDGVTVTQ